MRVDLPFPADPLWPNKRAHWAEQAREKKKHRAWAAMACIGKMPSTLGDGKIPMRLIVHAKQYGPLPDEDNCIAAMKAYQDGIADALGINDKHFTAPTVSFSERRTGRFVIEVGHVSV